MLTGLDKALEGLSPELSPMDRWMQAITLVRERILEVQAQAKKWITGRETEIAYFREVWPVFHSRLGLYIKVYQFELWRLTVPEEGWADLIRQEEGKVAGFFQVNGEFWMYYRGQSPVLNEQFTRTYSRSMAFDPLSLVIDPEGATLASYRAGECGAMEGYKRFLIREKNRLLGPSTIEDAEEYTWGAQDVDFVEWLNGMQAVGAVRYKGQPADLSRLEKWAAWALNKRVSNIYDRTMVIRGRKRERLKFTKRTEESLEKKWDAQDKRSG
jgi:hypothetical protein